jgi:hypothetical protein
MQIVSNTSPILNLAIINRLDLLKKQFTQVIIPEAVLGELKIETNLLGSSEIRKALDEGWIDVKKIKDVQLFKLLSQHLDFGESEASNSRFTSTTLKKSNFIKNFLFVIKRELILKDDLEFFIMEKVKND